jgi:tetratricopeptide (TPR) repeat protein
MAEARKHEKVSLTKWKPDWEAALGEYERAGTCYKGLKDYANAALAYSKAANAAYKIEIVSGAGKHYETAGSMLKEAKDLSGAADMFEKAAACFTADAATDRASEALVKGARAIEPESIERASELYTRAVAAWKDEEERPVEFSIETFKAACTFFLRTRQFRQAVVSLEELLGAHETLRQANSAAKCVLSIVIAELCADNYIGAFDRLEALEMDPAYADICRQDESLIARELLDAFAAQDEKALELAIAKKQLNYIDSQALKLARGLTLQAAAVPLEHVDGRAASKGRAHTTTISMDSLGAELPRAPPPPHSSASGGADDGYGAPPPRRLPAAPTKPAVGDFGEVLDDYTDDLT